MATVRCLNCWAKLEHVGSYCQCEDEMLRLEAEYYLEYGEAMARHHEDALNQLYGRMTRICTCCGSSEADYDCCVDCWKQCQPAEEDEGR